ncbi:MAG: class I SAM-dependent DNA methyltransferase [Solirubrobacteraceae bacterium]
MEARMTELRNHANLIWGIAELLRGDYKQADYGKVILPLVVMRRLDQALEETKDQVLARAAELRAAGIENVEPALVQVSGRQFYNASPYRLQQLLGDAPKLALNLRLYLDGFSSLAQEVFTNFRFDEQIDYLDQADLLYKVIATVCDVDLHPDSVSNLEMGYLFEELIRRFSEQSNETAGEHFTPREVVRLMVNLLLDGDEGLLRDKGVIRTVFDCACGTGGMLSEAEGHILQLNPQAAVHLYGQELNRESYAICLADMLVKGQDASHIVLGNSLSHDGHKGERFHYGIANPPFGVDWSKVEKEIRDEHHDLGFDGRFGPGLPSKSDGQLLFQLHLLSKMRDVEHGGGRVAIVHNGSPLFTGAAGSGPSEIRRWIIDNDYLEAIIALPEQLFYNTGIASYIWLLTNRKSAERAGKVQLIDARDLFVKMRKSLGEKRREISPEQVEEITRLHGEFKAGDRVKILKNQDFGYRTITVERPLRARWVIDSETWEGAGDLKALAKLEEAERLQVIAALQATPPATFGAEKEATGAIKAALAGVLGKVPAPIAKALAGLALRRDPDADPVLDKKGEPLPDPELRDSENVPLGEPVAEYLSREVLPHVPDAWVPDPAGKIGYEIPFTRLFYTYTPPRPSAEIKAELRELEAEIRQLLGEVLA